MIFHAGKNGGGRLPSALTEKQNQKERQGHRWTDQPVKAFVHFMSKCGEKNMEAEMKARAAAAVAQQTAKTTLSFP